MPTDLHRRDSTNRKIIKGAAVGAAGLAGGGYLGHQAVMDKYSPRFLRRDRSVGETYKAAATDVRQNATAAATNLRENATAVKNAGTKAGRKVYQGMRREGKGVLNSGFVDLNKGVRAALSKLAKLC